MGQKLVRQLISTSTGLPLTDKTVLARPIWATSAAHDQPMPETPASSGYYVSTTEVPHDTYRIYADNVDTGEMVTVRPGLLIVGAQGDEDSYAPRSLDRILNNKVTVSMFVADTSSAPTNDNFTAAVNFASASEKTLVLDYDFAPTTDLAISGNLSLDLNGHTLDFETNGVALTANVLSVKGLGTVKLKTGGKSLIGTGKLTVSHVTFSGDFESQATAVATDSYVGCKGVSGFKFSRTSGSYDYTVPRISGCDGGFDVASLVLADYDTDATGTASGDERRIDLQQTIDEELKRLHYLIGKMSSDTPYETGYFNDVTLSSISSLCGISQSLASISSFSSSAAEVIDVPEVDEVQLAQNPTGITLRSFSKADDGLYEIWANAWVHFTHHSQSGNDGGGTVNYARAFVNISETANPSLSFPVVYYFISSFTIGFGTDFYWHFSIPRIEVRFSKTSPTSLYLRLAYAFSGNSYADRARASYSSKIFMRKIGN